MIENAEHIKDLSNRFVDYFKHYMEDADKFSFVAYLVGATSCLGELSSIIDRSSIDIVTVAHKFYKEEDAAIKMLNELGVEI